MPAPGSELRLSPSENGDDLVYVWGDGWETDCVDLSVKGRKRGAETEVGNVIAGTGNDKKIPYSENMAWYYWFG